MKKLPYAMIPMCCLVFILLLFKFVLLVGYVPTTSMEPTLKKGSLILGCRLYDELKTGDIIIFMHNSKLLVKRIAASPGEEVMHGDTRITVPEDCFYVLGDNAENSCDSRVWAEPFVEKGEIIATALNG